MALALKAYYDLMSQPSRAIYIFLKATNITFEPCLVKLREGKYIYRKNYFVFYVIDF